MTIVPPKLNPCCRCNDTLVRQFHTLTGPAVWTIDHWCHDGEVRSVQGNDPDEVRRRWNAMNPVQVRVDSDKS